MHPDFEQYLALKPPELQTLYRTVRQWVLSFYPNANELLYRTQALTSAYSTSRQLKHAYCHIPIYSKHLNLGFNYGAMLDDAEQLLQGTGKLIRHIPLRTATQLDNPALHHLMVQAVDLSLAQLNQPPQDKGVVLSHIKST